MAALETGTPCVAGGLTMAEYIEKSEALAVLCAAPREWNEDCGISKIEYLKMGVLANLAIVPSAENG